MGADIRIQSQPLCRCVGCRGCRTQAGSEALANSNNLRKVPSLRGLCSDHVIWFVATTVKDSKTEHLDDSNLQMSAMRCRKAFDKQDRHSHWRNVTGINVVKRISLQVGILYHALRISHANKEGGMEHDGHGGNVIFSILGPGNK
jgi:hypothetical protein